MSELDYGNDYADTNSSGFLGGGYQRLNGLEIITIIFSLIVIVVAGLWGFNTNTAKNRDKQREHDIFQVIGALNQFYINSSSTPSQRTYPIARCTAQLNEVDFELTLRQHLTGSRPEIEPHAYITPDQFPRDRWGRYYDSFADRRIAYRCIQILGDTSLTRYNDNTQSCEFSSSNRWRKCYLYSSSQNGDKFTIGYWSESQNKFIIYERFREEFLTQVL